MYPSHVITQCHPSSHVAIKVPGMTPNARLQALTLYTWGQKFVLGISASLILTSSGKGLVSKACHHKGYGVPY